MGKSFFITGTGTDIGKTVVTCTIIRQLLAVGKSVTAIKPLITGWVDGSAENDTMHILTALGLAHNKDNINKTSPWRFKMPLAPSMAAQKEGVDIDYLALVEFCKKSADSSNYLLCEGAGGVIVPLNNRRTTLDLMSDLGFAAILVSGTYLGAISHTLTAIKALEGANIEIAFLVVNESEGGIPLADTVTELAKFTQHPIKPLTRVTGTKSVIWQRTDNIEF